MRQFHLKAMHNQDLEIDIEIHKRKKELDLEQPGDKPLSKWPC